jgi:hypothetical protein
VSATSIDGVLDRLQDAIDQSMTQGSRLGYFAALYKRMTTAVRDAITNGVFEDAARMTALDVAFANRYLDTRQQYFAGELHGQSWLLSYEAATSDKYTILQHLLIGINPHIMIDLGVAAARTCPGAQLAALQSDFNKINGIILGLMPEVDRELDRLSPITALLDRTIGGLKDKFINMGLDAGRASSWAFAQSLANMELGQQSIAIGKRDRDAFVIGECLKNDPIAHLIRRKESDDVRENLRVLCQAAANASPQTPRTSSPPR